MKEISSWRPPRLAETAELEYAYAAPTEEAHVRDYWKTVVKRRRLVLSVFFFVVGVVAYFNFTATPLFTATATIKIEPQNPIVLGIQEVQGLVSGGQYDYYQTQFALLEGRALAAMVISDLKLESEPAFINARIVTSNPISRIRSWFYGYLYYFIGRVETVLDWWKADSEDKNSAAEKAGVSADAQVAAPTKTVEPSNQLVIPAKAYKLAGRYLNFLDVKPEKGTRLVQIEFNTPDPRLSERLANAHAAGFIHMNARNRFELTEEVRAFLDAKNLELRHKVELSENALNRFRQMHGVVSLEKGENIIVDRLMAVNQQLTNARTQRIDAESLHRMVQNKSTQYLAQIMSQGLVPALKSRVATLESERARLSQTFKPTHPKMLELVHQIDEARQSLNNEIAHVVRGIQENYTAALNKEKALEIEAANQQQIALNLKQVGVEYAVLEEEVKVNRALYESVLKRLSETSVSNDLAVSNMRITERAEKPDGPSSPAIAQNLLLGTGFGLFLGIGLAFLLEYFDSRLSTPREVWRAVSLSTFGVVPDLNSLESNLLTDGRRSLRYLLAYLPLNGSAPSPSVTHDLTISHHPLSIVTESYRTIRSALLFCQAEKPPQVILLTSPAKAEGKTVTTLNLAIALAQESHSVLVVDADLRRGCCHRRLGIRNHKGLSNVLTGNLSLEEGISETSVRGLSLLSCGTYPPNPSDLLGSNKMREILSSLRNSFDFILIDSPPAIAISDVAVISSVCDGVLLVLHGKKTTTAAARQALERLESVGAPVLGVILNSVDLKNPDYVYFRDYYRSSYGSDVEPDFEVEPDNGTERIVEAAVHEELHEPWPVESGSGTVPHDFFDHMTSKLTEAIGPMAPLILQDQVALLGESLASFPKNRLKELYEKVCEEILDETVRNTFRRKIFNSVQSL